MKQRSRRMRQETCYCSLTESNSPAFTREPSAKCYHGQSQLWGDTLHITHAPTHISDPTARLWCSWDTLQAGLKEALGCSVHGLRGDRGSRALGTAASSCPRARAVPWNPLCWTDRAEKFRNSITSELVSTVYITMSHPLFHFKYCLNLRGIAAIWLWWRKMWRNVFPEE